MSKKERKKKKRREYISIYIYGWYTLILYSLTLIYSPVLILLQFPHLQPQSIGRVRTAGMWGTAAEVDWSIYLFTNGDSKQLMYHSPPFYSNNTVRKVMLIVFELPKLTKASFHGGVGIQTWVF